MQEVPAARAAAVTWSLEGATPAGVGQSACRFERRRLDDSLARWQQEVEPLAGARQYTQGCAVARGVTRTVATPQPPRRAGSPAIARTSGSPMAITSVCANSASKPPQYSS